MVDPKIIAQDARFNTESSAAEETFLTMDKEELATMHERFVKANGGALPSAEAVAKVKTPAERIKKENTQVETKKLLAELGSVQAVAAARSFTASTIAGHVETLVAEGEITAAELEAILAHEPGWDKETKKEIFAAIAVHGNEKLKPLYEETGEKYSYILIRLVRSLSELDAKS
jgi:hypothetical protein